MRRIRTPRLTINQQALDYSNYSPQKPGTNERGLEISARRSKRWEDAGPTTQWAITPRVSPKLSEWKLILRKCRIFEIASLLRMKLQNRLSDKFDQNTDNASVIWPSIETQ